VRKVIMRVGGGRSGRLVYWAYLVYGDVWSGENSQLSSTGFRFLRRKDKLGIACYLFGLRSALRDLLTDMERRGIHEQYLVRFYYVDDRLFNVLSKWGYGLRDPLFIGLVNEIRHLANRIGLLDLARPKSTYIEEILRIKASSQPYRRAREIIRRARVWDSSDEGGFVVCKLPSESEDIPLEFLAKILLKEEARAEKRDKRHRDLKGAIVIRECEEEKPLTRALFYSPEGCGEVARVFSLIDPQYRGGRLAARKSLCVTRSSADEIEEVLVEVFDACQA
jgi:hypothetical protein